MIVAFKPGELAVCSDPHLLYLFKSGVKFRDLYLGGIVFVLSLNNNHSCKLLHVGTSAIFRSHLYYLNNIHIHSKTS
jgi:hypothetical protein